MFNHSSDPWYTYMQPFRIVFLRKMIKAQHLAAKAQEEAKAQEAKEQEEKQHAQQQAKEQE